MEPALFDTQALEEWKEVDQANWQTLVSEILQLFLSTAKERQAALYEAWTNGEIQKVGQRAHALKSSCGSVGAVRANLLLQEIEKACGKNDLVKLHSLMRQFDEVFTDSVTQISNYFGEMTRR
jgi:HPt (histidine-containing phosphotransfer) domain-containing protein